MKPETRAKLGRLQRCLSWIIMSLIVYLCCESIRFVVTHALPHLTNEDVLLFWYGIGFTIGIILCDMLRCVKILGKEIDMIWILVVIMILADAVAYLVLVIKPESAVPERVYHISISITIGIIMIPIVLKLIAIREKLLKSRGYL